MSKHHRPSAPVPRQLAEASPVTAPDVPASGSFPTVSHAEGAPSSTGASAISTTDLTLQMQQMKEQGYTVFPTSYAEGSHDMVDGLSNILNFSGLSNGRNPLLAHHGGYHAPMPDPLASAGGFASTALAIPTPKDKDGHDIGTPGKGYIPWGANNNLPNVVALVNSQLVYTALCVKFNIDVLCGLGVNPIFEYHSTVGCNENEDHLTYRHAGDYLQRRIEQTRSKLFNLLKEHIATPSLGQSPSGSEAFDASAQYVHTAPTADGTPSPTVAPAPAPTIVTHPSQRPAPVPEGSPEGSPDDEATDSNAALITALHAPDGLGYKRHADTILDDMIISSRAQIARLEKEYKTWGRTNAKLQQFDRGLNAARFTHDLATDLVQYNLAFVEIDLSQDATRQRDSAQWRPTITGFRYRDALTCRFEEKDDLGVSRYVYVSNRWLDPLNAKDLTVDDMCAIPALDPSSPLTDLTQRIRDYRGQAASAAARLANFDAAHPELVDIDPATVPEDSSEGQLLAERAQLLAAAYYYANPANRPTRFILPIDYRTSGRFYYPQPAYWSIYKDIYQYAANIIRDRAIRKQNENMFTYVIYVHQAYLDKLANQQNAQKTEAEKQAIKQREIQKIKSFLSDKHNNGSTFSACTFVGQDGKDHDAFKIERIDYANSKQNAEADKTEITDMASLICFSLECHPDLIGATPGVSSNGGTYQREMLLINQAKKANMQDMMLAPYFLMRDFNGLDTNLNFKISQRVLTTLDASKTGMTEE